MVGEHIEERQGVYYVPGTRISLDSVVYAFREGCSPETIREDFAGLTLAHVYGAIVVFWISRLRSTPGCCDAGGNGPGWNARELRRARICRRVLRAPAAVFPSRASESYRY